MSLGSRWSLGFAVGLTLVGLGIPCLAETYPIVDTGQERCYDNRREIKYPETGKPFFGQDAQYLGQRPSYRDNGNGTVTDLVTGLMWQQDPGAKKTLEQAVAGASACRVGGYDDWRLPSIKDLYSLILFSGEDIDPHATDTSDFTPFVDTEYFKFSYGDPAKGERVIDSQMATSTKYVSTTMRGNETMFGVNFADGRIKGYPASSGRRGGRAKGYYVFYVRGNPEYGKNSFHDNGDRTITDRATGLIWAKLDSGHLRAGENKDGKLNWEQALRWVEELEYAGHSDWRLPNAKELQSIVDYTRSPDTTQSAAIDPVFSVTPIRDALGEVNYPFYWSSTTHKRMGGGSTAVYVAFGRSQGWMRDFRGQYDLLDVHGAGSQRSDPKAGDPAQFPRGRGPQGDVINIYNLVRPVRGGEVSARASGPELEPSRSGHSRHKPSPGGIGPGPGGPDGIGRGGMGPGRGGPGGMRPGGMGPGPGGPGGMGPGGMGRGGMRPRRAMGGNRPGFVTRLDRDGDAKVSRDEFDGPAAAFDYLDSDQDGYLTDDEGPGGPPPGTQPGTMPPRELGPERGPRRDMGPGRVPGGAAVPPFLQRFDRNQDGKVTREEFAGTARRFETLDQDGDGSVSSAEAAQGKRPPGAARQRPGNQRDRGGSATRQPKAGTRPGVDKPPPAPAIDPTVRADAAWHELPPSFVFILADDLGWTGLSCRASDTVSASRSDFYQTPRIAELARQGVRFSSAYSPSSMCTPSRASLLTGKGPALLRMTTPGPAKGQPQDRKLIPPRHVDALPAAETTVGEVLRRQGYATAHFGKWHLRGGGPGRHGFDQHDGDTENGGAGLSEAPNPKDVFGITKRALRFMCDQVAAGKPFYVQLSHYAVHGPAEALDSTKAACAERSPGTRHQDVEYAAMTRDLDTGVGMVLDGIDELKIAENTYVIFMSDNGAAAPPRHSRENQPLSGGKASFWEGGIRVPLIVRGPGTPPNSFCYQNVIGYDLFPTFCELAGVPSTPHSSIEGTSLVPLLLDRVSNSDFRRDQQKLVFHFPHYAKGPKQTPQSAILADNLKLIRFLETGETRLFDLSRDLGEKHDLTAQMPEESAALARDLDAYLTKVDAQMPSPNPHYDPAAAQQSAGQRRGRMPRRSQAAD